MSETGFEVVFEDVEVRCADGLVLQARYFHPAELPDAADRAVIVAPATGVQARYYRRFATHLARNGFAALVPDYRGIGRSAPDTAREYRALKARWHEWGTLDVEACILWLRDRLGPQARLSAVGHSFGGFAVVLAEHAGELDRVMMVGAQHAHWPDYAKTERYRLFLKWHVVMPVVAGVLGYFPGKRLGWLENLPKGVALDWARGAADYSTTIGDRGTEILGRSAHLELRVLAVNSTDDPYATPAAVRRTLAYLPRCTCEEIYYTPDMLGVAEIGHFGLFHDRFENTFWRWAVDWLVDSSAPEASSCSSEVAAPGDQPSDLRRHGR
ncbi:alpha/beta hydrolase family protein [Gordonia paraffinivorans]|uniref:alpha/beta hydrolase family protein n=1 Tax=Gordonia paraffinivorans TaxID=175628 RepID=UPI0014475B2B|nr:alpha/beta fold hydrolase [Gordonia paraffinivorans]